MSYNYKTINVKEDTFNLFNKIKHRLAVENEGNINSDKALKKILLRYLEGKEWE